MYSIETILELIPNRNQELDGDVINLDSSTLKLFKSKGTKCVICGLEGEYFAKRTYLNNGKMTTHLVLYAQNNNKEILFTKDHIIPVSKGGSNKLDNLQVMCQCCNSLKANHKNKKFKNLLKRENAHLFINNKDNLIFVEDHTFTPNKISLNKKKRKYNTFVHFSLNNLYGIKRFFSEKNHDDIYQINYFTNSFFIDKYQTYVYYNQTENTFGASFISSYDNFVEFSYEKAYDNAVNNSTTGNKNKLRFHEVITIYEIIKIINTLIKLKELNKNE